MQPSVTTSYLPSSQKSQSLVCFVWTLVKHFVPWCAFGRLGHPGLSFGVGLAVFKIAHLLRCFVLVDGSTQPLKTIVVPQESSLSNTYSLLFCLGAMWLGLRVGHDQFA